MEEIITQINWEEGMKRLIKKVEEAGGEIITWYMGQPIIKW